MPIWFEVIALSLAAYAIGLLLGWILWSGEFTKQPDETAGSGEIPQPETPPEKDESTTQ